MHFANRFYITFVLYFNYSKGTDKNKKEVMKMTGIDNKKITIVCYLADQITVTNILKKSLLEFVEWYERMKERNAHITPNGVNGAIVITDKRYFVINIED